MIQTVDLTALDSLPGVLAKLRAAQSERVLLVVDPKLAMDGADLRVLRREAAVCGKQVALLTSNVRIRRLAAREGISTFRSRAWAGRVRWARIRPYPIRRLRPVDGAEAVPPYGPGLLGPRSPSGFRPVSFLRSFARRRSPWWAELGMAAFLLLLFAGLLYALSIFIPAATVVLTPSAEPVQVLVPLRAIQDAVADADAGVVPARALSAQVSGEGRIPTTGRRLEPAAKAKGQVVLINRADRPVTVPAGTIVSTATGNDVRFATTLEAPLAPNARTTVPVEAVLPGPTGNVRAGTITRVEGPLGLSLLVANDSAFTGGTLAQVGVVTEEDKARLQAQVFEELKAKALERLNERVDPGGFIPVDSVVYSALSPTFTPFVGEVSPELFLSMSVQAVGLVVDAKAGNDVALARLRSEMPPGSRLISDTVRFIPGSVAVEDARTVSFSVIAEGMLMRGIDTGAVRAAITGMSPDRAAAVLAERFALAEKPEISLGPDWLPYIVPVDLPVLPWRIRVIVDWDRAASLAMNR